MKPNIWEEINRKLPEYYQNRRTVKTTQAEYCSKTSPYRTVADTEI